MSQQTHIRELSSEEKLCLDQWMSDQSITLDLRTRRYFSDVLPVAKIVKKSHGRLVDLHNYTPKSSLILKLQNWEIFNSKVLKKLGVNMTRSALEQLAAATPGAIETLLYELMLVTKSSSPRPSPVTNASPTRSIRNTPKKMEKEHSREIKKPVKFRNRPLDRSLTHVVERTSDLPPDVVTMNVNILVDGKVQTVPRKLVFYESYSAALRESGEKDNYINSINQKAQYLESIITVKEERIAELMEQLGKLSVSILSMRPMLNDNDDDNRINTSTPTHIKSPSEPFVGSA
ncbi:uncharacterized protein Dana_GF25154, isoform A [Drosophila ananassae]|uniref:Uncharacterized protein, isoform A n=1 Tax=Drosophila ananassae TaxID=7217 RepID=B3MAQ4_DROAN|nr:uncharacterized protein Dana_GF25154, isoform A [Drosophila ananassae]